MSESCREMTNEEIIIEQAMKPLAWKIKNRQTTHKLAQIINANLVLNPNQKLMDFGIRKTNAEYVIAEMTWYASQNLNLSHYPRIGSNKTWKLCATEKGNANSNYGYLAFSKDNYNQYENALFKFLGNKYTKQACLIYIRPEIVTQWNDGYHASKDYICTYGTSFQCESDVLHMCVNMRSNDLFTGLLNDFAWQATVYDRFYADVKDTYPELQRGRIFWHADNLHVYEKDYEDCVKIAEEKGSD